MSEERFTSNLLPKLKRMTTANFTNLKIRLLTQVKEFDSEEALANIQAGSLAISNAVAFGVKSIWDDIAPQDLQAVCFGLWFIASILLLFSNRYVFMEENFKRPITLAFWQGCLTTIVTRAFGMQLYLIGHKDSRSTITWSTYFKWIIPTGVCFAIATVGTSIATNYLPLMTGQLVPCIAALITEFGRKTLFIKNGGESQWWRIALISFCLAAASAGGLRFGVYDTELTAREKYGIHYIEQESQPKTEYGVAVALLILGVLAECVASVCLERSLRAGAERTRPSDMLYHFIPVTTIVLGISSLSVESGAIGELFQLSAPVLFTSGFCGLAVFTAIPHVIEITSSTTLSLAGGLKNVFCTFLACIIYSIGVGYLHAIGFFFALLGFSKYMKREADANFISPGGIDIKAMEGFTILNQDAEAKEFTGRDANGHKLREDDTTLHMNFEDEKTRPPPPTSYNLFSIVIILIILVVVTATDRVPHGRGSNIYRTPVNRTKIASIIEPRNLAHLAPLVLHFLSVLPPDWPVVVWCSPENIEVLKHCPPLLRHIDDGRLNLTLIPHTIVDIHNGEYLTRFLTKPWFWEQFGEAEWMLFFQSDSILCSRSEQSIEDWVGFDWVGAPWNDNVVSLGGNGGLSMRKISSMLTITRDQVNKREDNGLPEDVFFSESLAQMEGVNWPTQHQGLFSVEEQHLSMKEWAWTPFGMHSGGISPSTWHDRDRMGRLMKWCPEVKLFYDSLANL